MFVLYSELKVINIFVIILQIWPKIIKIWLDCIYTNKKLSQSGINFLKTAHK